MIALRLRGNLSPNVFLYQAWPLVARGAIRQTSTKGNRNGGEDSAVATASLVVRCAKIGRE